jgi:predicted nuclease with TOPRIM domain
MAPLGTMELSMDPKDMSTLEELLTRVIDAKLDQAKKEFNHQVTMQAELTQNKLDLIVEGQQSLVQRMDRLEGRMDGIESRLDRVEVRVVAVERKIDIVEKKVDALDKKVDAVDKKVDAVAVDVAEHRHDTEAHRKGLRVREEESGE